MSPIQMQEMTEATPVALQTRRCRQQTAAIRKNDDEGDLFQVTNHGNKNNELIRHLMAKIKEQNTAIIELSSAVELYLKIQPIVKKLQGNIC